MGYRIIEHKWACFRHCGSSSNPSDSALTSRQQLHTLLTLLGVIVSVAWRGVIAIYRTRYNGRNSIFVAGVDRFQCCETAACYCVREDMIRFNRRKEVTKEDAEAVMRLCRSCSLVGMALNGGGMVKFADNESEGVSIRGLSPSMFDIENTTIPVGPAMDGPGGLRRSECLCHRDRSARKYL